MKGGILTTTQDGFQGFTIFFLGPLGLAVLQVVAQVRGAKARPDGGGRVRLRPLRPTHLTRHDWTGGQTELHVRAEAFAKGPCWRHSKSAAECAKSVKLLL